MISEDEKACEHVILEVYRPSWQQFVNSSHYSRKSYLIFGKSGSYFYVNGKPLVPSPTTSLTRPCCGYVATGRS